MSSTPASASIPAAVGDRADDVPFDFRARVDELRCHGANALRVRLSEARCQEQRWRLESLAVTRALEEMNALDAIPDASVSARTAKTNREVARSLESLPQIAAAAWAGT